MKQKKIPTVNTHNFPCYISTPKFNRLMLKLTPQPTKLFPRIFKLYTGEIIKLDKHVIYIYGVSATLDFHFNLNAYLNHNIKRNIQEYLTFYSDLRQRLRKYNSRKRDILINDGGDDDDDAI